MCQRMSSSTSGSPLRVIGLPLSTWRRLWMSRFLAVTFLVFGSYVIRWAVEVGMIFRKTSMGWMDESENYWDDDEFAGLLAELAEGSMLRLLAEDDDEDDNDS